MDVRLLLNTAGDPLSKPTERSAIADGDHTVPSSTLPTPSSDCTLSSVECENSPHQDASLWGPRGYSLEPLYSSETEIESFLFETPRASSAQPPHTIINRALKAHHINSDGFFHSPEQGDAECGMPALGHLPLNRHEAQSANISPTSWTHSRASAVAFGRSCETTANTQEGFYASRAITGSIPMNDQDDIPSSQPNDNSTKTIHKKEVSAPDIAPCSVARMPYRAGQPIQSETSSSRLNRDHSTAVEPLQSLSSTQTEPKCLIKDCDTGSQLRKAISHLFGRNKACTLRIPKHIWISYCRKHYQRIRYHNAETYPLTQMELVKLQIWRLQTWSDENKKRGSGPYIRMWMLSLRKRQQSRPKHDGASAVDECTTTAVPPWLIQHVAAGHSTENILSISEHLYTEIKDRRLAQVPEIEFLPDIIDPDSVKASNAARSSRRLSRPASGTKTPKRKAPESLDLDRHDAAYSDGASVEVSRHHSDNTYETVSPSGRRARVVHPSYDTDADSTRIAAMVSTLAYNAMQTFPPPSVAAPPDRVPAAPIVPPSGDRRRSNAQYNNSSLRQGSHSRNEGDPMRSAGSDGHHALYSGRHQGLPPVSTQSSEYIHSPTDKRIHICNDEENESLNSHRVPRFRRRPERPTDHKSLISHRTPAANDSRRSQAPADYKLPVTEEFGAPQESQHDNQPNNSLGLGSQPYEYSGRYSSMSASSPRSEEHLQFAPSRNSTSQHVSGRYNDTGVMSGDTKRRGNLPKETTDKLRAWFVTHLQHPYPTEDEKQDLMRQTGLQMNQISNWFINARRRQLPAMINNARAETDIMHSRAAPDGAFIGSADCYDMGFSRVDSETSHDAS